MASAELVKEGLKWDRRWCVIKEANKRFVTQREQPKLALVRLWLMYANSGGLRTCNLRMHYAKE